MDIEELKRGRVAILGFGQEGQAVAEYLMSKGVDFTVFDESKPQQWSQDRRKKFSALRSTGIFGKDAFEKLKEYSIIFRSPGINPSKLALVSSHAKITSQTQWFFENCQAKIIGVTGTKGKGTTCSLIYHMLKDQGRQTYLTGNIGKISPLEILDSLSKNDWVIFELSSFQLHDMSMSPQIAVVLMVTSEHLDYHENESAYVSAKSTIAKFQHPDDKIIVNQDYENSRLIGEQSRAEHFFVSTTNKVTPGVCISLGNVVFNSGIGEQIICPVENIALPGKHNWENACAASAAAILAGCEIETVAEVLKKFRGLEHRLELVDEKQGIKFFDDSFSTTPETAIAAIQAFKEPEILILGGSSKRADFGELAKTILAAENIKALVLVGAEAERIKKALDSAGGARARVLTGARNMQEIFSQIKSVAVEGDIVLLSPACASFDMFENYQDRGKQFKKQVNLW